MFLRNSSTAKTGGKRGRRRLWIILGAVVLGLYLILTALSSVWTDYLWFASVDLTSVWRLNLFAGLGLALFGIVVVWLIVWGNLLLLGRITPFRWVSGDEEAEDPVDRFRQWAEPRIRLLRWLVSILLAIMLGAGLAGWRDEVLLFLNSTTFGIEDPQFGTDLSFYMFRLPVWTRLVDWLFTVTVLTTILVAALHYLNGGIRWGRPAGLEMSRGVKAHLSVLVGVLALLRAVSYRIDRWELLYSDQGAAPGASYTDVTARLPALNLLVLVSVVAAVLIIINIWRKGWVLTIVSVGSWILISLLAGLAYPAIIQRFTVNPDELNKERPYIARTIEATREAFGLSDVEVRPFAASGDLDAGDLANNQPTVDNIRLLDPDVLVRTYQNLQEIRTYYKVDRVDTDRYVLDDQFTQVMVSVRELDEASLPATDWQNRTLAYTHGFGAVLSPANQVGSDGQPVFTLRDVPPVTDEPILELDQARVYFGETYDPGRPVIVGSGTQPQEVDFPLTPTGTALNEYDGSAGVELSSVLHRLAFALRYRDLNMLISSQIRGDSRILMERNIRSRLEQVAPFLRFDADPYPVLVDERITWVYDLYTISDRYPYSQSVEFSDTARLARNSGLPGSDWNYMRNSVKATVDSFDGTMRLYVVDPSDPVVSSWQKIYPDLFTPASEMPRSVQEHLRYPSDMFKIQSEIYLDYHMDDTDVFFRRDDAWEVPEDPSTIRRFDPDNPTTAQDLLRGDTFGATGTVGGYLKRMLPYYLLVRLPGESELSYVLLQPFNPEAKRNMASFLLADASPGRYGRLIDYRLPRESVVDGPGQVGNRIDQDPLISEQISLWDTQGSTVLFGDLLVIPIEESVVYVQPVYLEAEEGGLPEFRKAIVVFQDRVEWRDSLDEALIAVFGTGEPEPSPPPDTEEPTPAEPDPPDEEPEVPTDGSLADLLNRATDAFTQAEQALRAGDLAEYQRLVNRARALLEQARSQIAEGV